MLLNLHRLKYVYKHLDKRLIILFTLLLLILYKSNIMQTGLYPNIAYITRYALIPMIIVYFIISIIRNKNDMIFFEKTIIYVGSISMLIAIFQFFQFELAWQLREIISSNGFAKIPSGLAFFSITYSYQMLILISLVFSKYLTDINIKTMLWFFIVLFGLFASISKSATLGFSLAMLILFIKTINLNKIIFFMVILTILISLYLLQDFKAFIDHSVALRTTLFTYGFKSFIDFIFVGMGNLVFFQHIEENYNFVIPTSPHNSYLNFLIKNGILAIIPLIYFYIIYFSNIRYIKRYDYRLYVFFYVYIISYSFHSFFHNAGIFNGDQLFWLIFAYLLAIKKIYRAQKNV